MTYPVVLTATPKNDEHKQLEISFKLSGFASCCGIRIAHAFLRRYGSLRIMGVKHPPMLGEARNLFYEGIYWVAGYLTVIQGASKIAIADRVRAYSGQLERDLAISCHEFMLHHKLPTGGESPNYNHRTQDILSEYTFTREQIERIPKQLESENYIIKLDLEKFTGRKDEYSDISWG